MGPEVALVPTLVSAPIGASAVAMLPATSAAAGSFGFGSILSGVGSAFSALSALQQGRTAQGNAALQAELFSREAAQRRQASEADAEMFRRRQDRLQGTLRARVGGSGVTMEGTPLMVAEDIASEAELQRLRILHGGIADESRLESQAGLSRFSGAAARQQGNLRAGSYLLRGAGQLFGNA